MSFDKKQKINKVVTSENVYYRMFHDSTLPYDKVYITILISDRVLGDREIEFNAFTPIKYGGDIPFDHIIAFKYKSEVLWDRRTQIDKIFNQSKMDMDDSNRTTNDQMTNGSTLEYLLPIKKGYRNVLLHMCGSFFPIHNNHIWLLNSARQWVNNCGLPNSKYHCIGAVITLTHPNGLRKKYGNSKCDKYSKYRSEICRLAVADTPNIAIDDWLSLQPKNCGAAAAKKRIQKLLETRYDINTVTIATVIGDDNIMKMQRAIKYGLIVCVLNRGNGDTMSEFCKLETVKPYLNNLIVAKVDLSTMPCTDISATAIRKAFASGDKDDTLLKEALHPKVLKYHRLYRLDYKDLFTHKKKQKNPNIAVNRATVTQILQTLQCKVISDRELTERCKIGNGLQGCVTSEMWVTPTKDELKSDESKSDESMNVAVKTFKMCARDIRTFARELLVLQSVNHPNIVHCYGAGFNDNWCHIVLQLLYQPLKQFVSQSSIKSDDKSSSKWCTRLAHLANGINHFHKCGFVHRDLTCDNIMIRLLPNDDFHLIIIDFGCATKITQSNTIFRGSMRHYAPESIGDDNGYEYTPLSEVFSFGHLMYELLHSCGGIIFNELSTSKAIEKILSGERPPFQIKCNPKFEKLVRLCWNEKPIDRPTFSDIQKCILQIN